MKKEELEKLDKKELIEIILLLIQYKELADFQVETLKKIVELDEIAH